MLLGSRKNVLLVKDDVGRPKPTTKNLPGEDFAFGRDKRYVESAAQVINEYESTVAQVPRGRKAQPDIKDFKRLNKVVLKEGATSAAANRRTRANHDLKVA